MLCLADGFEHEAKPATSSVLGRIMLDFLTGHVPTAVRDHLYRSESATVIALSALAWVSALGCTISPRATDTVTHDGSREVRFLGLTPTSPESPTAPQIQALLPGETWHTLARTGVLPTEPILLGSLTLYPYTGSAEVPDAFWQRRLFNRYEARVRVIEEGGSLGPLRWRRG